MMKYIPTAVLLILFLLPNSAAAEPVKWMYVYHRSALSEKDITDALKNNDIICLTGYTLTEKGRLKESKNRLTRDIIRLSKRTGTVIYPVINLQGVKQGMRLLDSHRNTQRAADEISILLKKYSSRGVHLDFEYLPAKYSESYANFTRLLRKKIQSAEISIAVFPQVDFPQKWSQFHNPDLLKNHVDSFVIMCYDQHGKGTNPGPVADISWVEKNILFYQKRIDSAKLILGIPAYGYIWSSDGRCRAVSAKHGKILADQHGFTRHSSGNMYIRFISSHGTDDQAYISDNVMRNRLREKSIKMKLKGWAVWRKGFEDK